MKMLVQTLDFFHSLLLLVQDNKGSEKVMNKYKLYMIVSIMILVVSITGTVAWYTWSSTDNTSVSLGMCTPEISFIGGTTLNGERLKPVTDRSNGLKKQIDVYLNKTCKENDSGVMNLYMKLDLLPDALKHETFIYEVIKDDVVLYSDNFKDKQQGETIELLTDQIITENDSIYFIYVYIDGTRDNPLEMAGKSFKFTVYGEGTGAIYRNNVISNPSAPSSSSSTFLNTQITRNSIQTITIAEDNTVPDGITGTDISSKGDGSVMLWYEDKDGDGLLDIYMGSENGVIETNTNGQGMFAYLENVEYLDLTNLDTSNITNMSSMFQGSKSLKKIELSNFDTSNVTSMYSMFNGCNSITELDVSSFDTSKVTSMRDMFSGCNSITKLDLNSFDTSNVTDMYRMFQNCTSLIELDISNWQTSNVTSVSRMFNGCSSLVSLDLSKWDTSNVTDIGSGNTTGGMFAKCSSLKYLNLSNWNLSKATSLRRTFFGCSSLTDLILTGWDTSNISNFNAMFQGCSSLITLDVSSFDTSNATDMSNMFSSCSSLTILDLSKWDTSNVTNINYMFMACNKLNTIYVSELWKTSAVINSTQMFAGCASLVGGAGTKYNLSNLDVTYARIDREGDNPGYLTLKTI